MDTWPRRFCRLLIARLPLALALLSGCAGGPGPGSGPQQPRVSTREPATRPLPRLETGMHTAPIRRIATDAAGRWAVTASDDKTARVWEVATGRQVWVLRPPQGGGDEGKLYPVALSPDGALVALGGWTGYEWDGQESIYLFNRADGRLLRRLTGLPEVINHLAFSPDGRWLAATLGGNNGIRIFDAASGAETGRDMAYGDHSYSAHFSPDGRRLVTTSFDGQVRLYVVDEGRLGPPMMARPGGGQRPFAARFSPNGRLIAVGFEDTSGVQVLDAKTLAEVARPYRPEWGNQNLSSVAWNVDGRYLFAGGRWNQDRWHWLFRWRVGDWSRWNRLSLTRNTLLDLVPRPGGGVVFAAGDPAWGAVDAGLRVRTRRFGDILDFRGSDLTRLNRSAMHPPIAAARTSAPGMDVQRWKSDTKPTLNGRPIALKPFETSRSLATAPDNRRFALGTEWYLRLFDRAGQQLWSRPVPGAAWSVNWSADGRFLVAACGDGTIRWHRAGDGEEVLAIYADTASKRAILWTPEGFYTVTGPDAEDLMGYHLNRGKDREGEFVSARQLRERFYQPALIARRLDPDGDALMAQAVGQLGDVRQLLAGTAARPPRVEVLSGGAATGEEGVTLTLRVHDQGGGIGGLTFYVDGRPQAGRQAGGFADATQSRIIQRHSIPLSPGRHRLEVAARNSAGVEGPRERVTATATGTDGAGALHILAVGVERYQTPGLSLRNSVADAQAVADELAARGKPLFKRVFPPLVLKDADASLAGIEGAFAEIEGRMRPKDTLVIFLAGHGEAPIGKGYTFLPADFRRGARGAAGEGLSERRLRGLLAQSPANTLLLLDTCDAGGAVEMIAADYERLGRVSRPVIGASRRGEFAQEGYQGHGVFTAALLKVMRSRPQGGADRALRVLHIAADTDREVRQIAQDMGGGYRQTVFAFPGTANFPVAAR